MDTSQKLDRLYAIAETDDIYLTWKHTYEECTQLLKRYADTQPFYATILAYTEAGRMMAQRVALLACEHMEFSEDAEEAGGTC